MTCILPCWDAFQYPKLFIDIEPLKEAEPLIPVDYKDDDDYNIILRDRWDARILRNVFDETLIAAAKQEGIPAVTLGPKESSDFEDKRVMDETVEDLAENWEASQLQLERLKEKKAVTKESSGKYD
ncbi:hypothetical protein VTN00DRAFT_2350 [Thermoascus crustaceus]|uniref:uncharacterized protein n=1 Tax=Thermoascus crustaceus TaxID=5088 RepID=UPI003742EC4A